MILNEIDRSDFELQMNIEKYQRLHQIVSCSSSLPSCRYDAKRSFEAGNYAKETCESDIIDKHVQNWSGILFPPLTITQLSIPTQKERGVSHISYLSVDCTLNQDECEPTSMNPECTLDKLVGERGPTTLMACRAMLNARSG
jgi:hypothetical protein